MNVEGAGPATGLMGSVRAIAPGRVNLVGDHTDYSGGFALPMAIDRATTVRFRRGGRMVELVSSGAGGTAVVPIGLDGRQPASFDPPWARYVAAVMATVQAGSGGRGDVSTTLPLGAGLSSSAALEVAVALALGAAGSPLELAQACQRAEHLATGVPCGVMDQLCSLAGQAGHALLMDCRALTWSPVPLPDDVGVVVVHSGQSRTLSGSAYARRVQEVNAAQQRLGAQLRDLSVTDVTRSALPDDLQRRRARHVVSENARVLQVAEALADGALPVAGALLTESHASLRDDFEVSTPVLDVLVSELVSMEGVLGARLTGAGFGGCAVALVRRGAGPAVIERFGAHGAWTVSAAAGAAVEALDG